MKITRIALANGYVLIQKKKKKNRYVYVWNFHSNNNLMMARTNTEYKTLKECKNALDVVFDKNSCGNIVEISFVLGAFTAMACVFFVYFLITS